MGFELVCDEHFRGLSSSAPPLLRLNVLSSLSARSPVRMESPQLSSSSSHLSSEHTSSRSRSSTKIFDDVTSLTSTNPFAEEDEHDQSSYAIVTSLFSKVRSTLVAPLSSAVASSGTGNQSNTQGGQSTEQRRPSILNGHSNHSSKSSVERHALMKVAASNPAPPLVSLTPVVSETPSYVADYDRPPSRGGSFYAPDTPDGGVYGTAIPGFPIQDSDARSIRTTTGSIRRSASVSKVIRRIRGEGVFSTANIYAVDFERM